MLESNGMATTQSRPNGRVRVHIRCSQLVREKSLVPRLRLVAGTLHDISKGWKRDIRRVLPRQPASAVSTGYVQFAYARLRRGCYSDMEQLVSRRAKSSVSGGGHVARRVHEIAACNFPARQACTHRGPIRQASRNAGARQPWGLVVSTPARAAGRG